MVSHCCQLFITQVDCCIELRLLDHEPNQGALITVARKAGVSCNCLEVSTLLDTGKSGDWEKTVQIFDALQDSKLNADVWTYTSVINACQSCGNDWQSGIEVFQDMEFQGASSLCSVGDITVHNIDTWLSKGQQQRCLYDQLCSLMCLRHCLSMLSHTICK